MKIKALNFPEPLKSLILSEPDFIESNDFVLKLGTWEKLLLMETNNEKRK
jgi:thiamine phosphate synthase YjbQ (UPF0047 family)